MTDGDLAAQAVRMDDFGWVHMGFSVQRSEWGLPLRVDMQMYGCPRCGALVADDWRVRHMDHHGEGI